MEDFLEGRESVLSLDSIWSNQTDMDGATSSLESWGEDVKMKFALAATKDKI